MTETINRQPQGIPSGCQFAPTAHSEPDVSLTPTAPAYDDEVQKERLAAIADKCQAIHRLQTEMDLLNVDAAVASVRRNFPDAAELHVDNARHGWTGAALNEYAPIGLRDKDGNDITPDDPHWFDRRHPDDDNTDPGVSIHMSRLGRGFFGYEHEGIHYDPETGHRVIDMNHTFSA
ncbi:MAG TPA: hypothetical protein DEP82_06370 [Arthrobacter bacterium]|jgi:hypothetical protein|nr:hypothetical protein [Arthrobacter sp.]HCB57552.1 hypothetical protein [Arthrobacter sp.]HCC41059.1 hypothetical protein [Arthrobacter sp.]